MKHKPGVDKSPCKVISFKNYKHKKANKISSTIAAIIAIKVEHPSDVTPEDFFLNNIESVKDLDINFPLDKLSIPITSFPLLRGYKFNNSEVR